MVLEGCSNENSANSATAVETEAVVRRAPVAVAATTTTVYETTYTVTRTMTTTALAPTLTEACELCRACVGSAGVGCKADLSRRLCGLHVDCVSSRWPAIVPWNACRKGHSANRTAASSTPEPQTICSPDSAETITYEGEEATETTAETAFVRTDATVWVGYVLHARAHRGDAGQTRRPVLVVTGRHADTLTFSVAKPSTRRRPIGMLLRPVGRRVAGTACRPVAEAVIVIVRSFFFGIVESSNDSCYRVAAGLLAATSSRECHYFAVNCLPAYYPLSLERTFLVGQQVAPCRCV